MVKISKSDPSKKTETRIIQNGILLNLICNHAPLNTRPPQEVWKEHKSKIKTEAKAKVVASIRTLGCFEE